MKRCVSSDVLSSKLLLILAHQINNLEAQLEAQKTKTSLLQQRLVSALDALDHLQTQYSLELDTEAGKRRHMETKLRRYLDTVQAAEVERDDLRDAVMKLVMKGGHMFISSRRQVEACIYLS
jgi:hypothetical protein